MYTRGVSSMTMTSKQQTLMLEHDHDRSSRHRVTSYDMYRVVPGAPIVPRLFISDKRS